MTDVDRAIVQRFRRNPPDADQQARLNDLDQPSRVDESLRDFHACRPAVRQGFARQMWMGWDGIPQDYAALGAEFCEDAVDDRSGGFLPGSRTAARSPVGIAPAQEVEFAGEGDARPAHALIARCFANGDDVGLVSLLEVIAEVGEPDRRRAWQIVRSGVPELVEAGANRQDGQLVEQRLERGRLATIGQ